LILGWVIDLSLRRRAGVAFGARVLNGLGVL
jgi:hypothetical protein